MKSNALAYAMKFMLVASLIVICVLFIGFYFYKAIDKKDNSASVSPTPSQGTVLVIDAGHGGEDAGAIAEDSTLEKDLNLKISTLIKVLCDINGTKAVMTREDDRLLYDHYGDLKDYTGHKKEYDLKNRVRIAKELDECVFLSIHMNKFSSSKYSGTQIYYSKNNPSSELLARAIQNMTRAHLQPNNNRKIKPSGSSIYVLNSIDCPAVLVECGFLSNEAELERLKDDGYQAKLALTIFASVLPSLE